jgi:hypothetical protein
VTLLRNLAFGAILVAVLAACGAGGTESASSGSGKGANGLVGKVAQAHVHITGGNAVATTTISVGGVPGKHVVLQWGLVDALQGGESQVEKVVHGYTTTRAVKTYKEAIRIPMSTVLSPVLVHFVLYAPDGSFLSSSDTPQFGDN